MEKNKHLTDTDRHFIEDSLNHKMSYVSIASALGKDPTTISKEVKAHVAKNLPYPYKAGVIKRSVRYMISNTAHAELVQLMVAWSIQADWGT